MKIFALLSKKRHFWLYLVTIVASLGGLLAGFDMGVISGAMLFINTEWELSPFAQGWVVSSAIVGAVIGAAGNGILSDLYGRKKIIIATALIFIAGSVFSAVAPNVGSLIAARMLVGVAVGMVNFIVPIYLSEISPQKIRGMLVSLYQLAITAGVMVYIACFAFSLGPVTWIMVSEILPLRIRGLAMSICTVSNFFFNFIIVLSFPVLLQHIGEAYTFWTYAGICFVSLFFFRFFVPETKGRSLEEIERNWQQGVKARNF